MKAGNPGLDRVLNPKEVADLLSIKLSTLFSHLSRGTPLPPFFKVGSQTRWRESVVWDWILQREKERKRKRKRRTVAEEKTHLESEGRRPPDCWPPHRCIPEL